VVTITFHIATFSTIMKSHTPRSTVFPYTTLFRSSNSTDCERGKWCVPSVSCLHITAADIARMGGAITLASSARATYYLPVAHDKDRKSTRLNSSHVKISYAVFCLKKNNTKKDTNT